MTHGDFTSRDWKDGLCELLCGEGKAEGRHFAHPGLPCSWHDGTCEEANADESKWCPCGRDEVARHAWQQAHGS